MKFDAQTTPLDGLMLLTRQQLDDQRGSFSRLFCAEQLRQWGWPNGMAQSNLSQTKTVGTIRGLHFQHPPHAETKLVTCIAGSVFDVAVDLRTNSTTFGTWFGAELKPENGQCILIPPGFAHGFQTLKPETSMVYFHSTKYAPAAESGVRFDDPALSIDWPFVAQNVSERDLSLPDISALGEGIEL